MAVSSLPVIGFTLTIPNTTTVVEIDDIAYGIGALSVPDNCNSIVIYNMATADRIFFKFMPPPGIPASVVVGASTVVPAVSSFTIALGFLSDRGPIGSNGETNIYFMAETGAAVQVNVTYSMGRGSSVP